MHPHGMAMTGTDCTEMPGIGRTFSGYSSMITSCIRVTCLELPIPGYIQVLACDKFQRRCCRWHTALLNTGMKQRAASIYLFHITKTSESENVRMQAGKEAEKAKKVTRIVQRRDLPWEKDSIVRAAYDPEHIPDCNVQATIGKHFLFHEVIPKAANGLGYLRVTTKSLWWQHEHFPNVWTSEGLTTCMENGYQWTINSTTWNHLRMMWLAVGAAEREEIKGREEAVGREGAAEREHVEERGGAAEQEGKAGSNAATGREGVTGREEADEGVRATERKGTT
jgi:hypothetical protein